MYQHLQGLRLSSKQFLRFLSLFTLRHHACTLSFAVLCCLLLGSSTAATPDTCFQATCNPYMLHKQVTGRALRFSQRAFLSSSSLFASQHRSPQTNSIASIRKNNIHRPLTTRHLYAMSDFTDNKSSQEGERLFTPYEQWVRRLYQTNLFHPVKLGLQNIEAIHDALGNPMDKIPVIHIAGTNGKGSVALKIASTLQLLNPSLQVGLFCSPHVSSFRERMQINGQLISEKEVVDILPEIYKICEDRDIPATFFEITTALAFQHFSKANVVVLETGLGGRLDATNVIKAPTLSIITSIGLEHTRILGDTVEKIALEKGGIIKEGRPVLVGPNVPHDVLRQCASEKKASEYLTCDDVVGKVEETITDYDKENARTAKAALTIFHKYHSDLFETLDETLVEQGTSARPPCRFEIVKREDESIVILDVAHNPPAMEYLLRKLKSTYPERRPRIVVGMSRDKDLALIGSMLLDHVDAENIHLVEAYHPRAATLEVILEAEPRLIDTSQYDNSDPSITNQIKSALKRLDKNEEVLVVCGSVFLMAEAREALGFDEPRDSEHIAEVAGANLRHGQEVFGNTNPSDSKPVGST